MKISAKKPSCFIFEDKLTRWVNLSQFLFFEWCWVLVWRRRGFINTRFKTWYSRNGQLYTQRMRASESPTLKLAHEGTPGTRVDGNISDNFLSYCTPPDYLCHECPLVTPIKQKRIFPREKVTRMLPTGVCKSENRLSLTYNRSNGWLSNKLWGTVQATFSAGYTHSIYFSYQLDISVKEIIQHYGLNFSTKVCKQYHRDKNLEQNEYINKRPT